MRDLGLGIDAARAAALLGRALLAQDRGAEAEKLSHESELLAGDDLQAAIAWRGVRAEALARRGEHAAAIEYAPGRGSTDVRRRLADTRLARERLGFSAEVGLEDGLARLVDWWRAAQ